MTRPLVVVLVGLGLSQPTPGRARFPVSTLWPALRASEVFQVADNLGSGDSYDFVTRFVFDNSVPVDKRLTAFEENGFFIHAAGTTSWRAAGFQGNRRPESSPRLIRRVIVLKASVIVVDDEVLTPDSQTPVEWSFHAQKVSEVTDHKSRMVERNRELFCETLLPLKRRHRVDRTPTAGAEADSALVEVSSPETSGSTRFLHVLDVSPGGQSSGVQSDLVEHQGQWRLTIRTENRIFHLRLPSPEHSPGEIGISTADGKPLLENRPLAAGILPHGPEGMRMLERWNSDYQGKNPPLWDIGRRSDELAKVVNAGTVQRCRVVDLCCGSGTDAIYLASQGFDVTAIDIAPTALSKALRKSRAAGVSVRWLLADVLAPPKLEPFEFIYDRGCYHVLRDLSLVAYMETIRRLSHPGSQFLLLSARADGQDASASLSGVTEEELRFDFISLFEIESLREIRLESNRPGPGPPGWSVLMRRTSKP